MLMYYGNALQTAGVQGKEGRSSLGKRSGNRDGRSDPDSGSDRNVAVAVTPPRPRRGPAPPMPSRDPESQNDFCTERPSASVSVRGGA